MRDSRRKKSSCRNLSNSSAMIPREILKKIRLIELRTNRIVTGLAATIPCSAPLGVGSGVENPFEGEMCPILRSEVQKLWFLTKNHGSAEKNRGLAEINLGSTEVNRGLTGKNRCLTEYNFSIAEYNFSLSGSNRDLDESNRGSEAINRGMNVVHRGPGGGRFHFSLS
jgi:hypothetical protein